MQASVIERPLAHFVGLRLTASFDSLVETQANKRKQLLARQFEIEALVNSDEQLGVTLPNEPESADETVTTYIGFQVKQYKNVPRDMVMIELASGRYAQFQWNGPMDSEEFDAFYPTIFGWLQQQNLAPSQTDPWIEIYGRNNDWDNRSDPQNELSVLLPLGGSTIR